MPISLPKRCIAEAVGTFALVFAGCGAVATDSTLGGLGLVGIALVFGLVVMAMVYAFGHVSGAHINPAVTVALLTKKMIPPQEAVAYIVAQIVGAIAAAALLKALFFNFDGVSLGVTNPADKISVGTAIGFEVVTTFFLVLMVLQVVSGPESAGTLAGVSIGGVVALDVFIAGPICGASMNPARSIGPALVAMDVANLWIYIVAPIGGALLAVVVAQAIRPGVQEKE